MDHAINHALTRKDICGMPATSSNEGSSTNEAISNNSLVPAPRMHGRPQTVNPYSIFERIIQAITDAFDKDVGATFRKYRIIANVTEFCKHPESWSKDAKSISELQFRLEELSDMSILMPELAKLGTSYASVQLIERIKFLAESLGDSDRDPLNVVNSANYKLLLTKLRESCLDIPGLKVVVNGFFKNVNLSFDKAVGADSKNLHLSPEESSSLRKLKEKLKQLAYEVGSFLAYVPKAEIAGVRNKLVSLISGQFSGGSREISDYLVKYNSEIQEKSGKCGGEIISLSPNGRSKVLNTVSQAELAAAPLSWPGENTEHGEAVLEDSLKRAAINIKENQYSLKKQESALFSSSRKSSEEVVRAERKYIARADWRALLKGKFAIYFASIENAHYALPAIKNSLLALCTELNFLSSNINPRDKNIFFSEIRKMVIREGASSLFAATIEKLVPGLFGNSENENKAQIKLCLEDAVIFLKNVDRKASYNEVLRGKVDVCFEGNYDGSMISVTNIYKNLSDLEAGLDDDARTRLAELVKEKTKKYPRLNHSNSVLVTRRMFNTVSRFDSSDYTGIDGSTYGAFSAVKAVDDAAEEMLLLLS